MSETGFLNLDLYLVELFCLYLNWVRNDPEHTAIADVFGKHTPEYRGRIASYLASLNITTDIREREEGVRYLYILPSFPMADLPFPQIGIYLGEEVETDHYLGDIVTDEQITITGPGGEPIAVDNIYGECSQATYRADVLDNSKEAVVWLSRLCQRAIISKKSELSQLGAQEINMSLSDLKIEQEQFPTVAFGRALTVTSKIVQTWKKREPIYTYGEGVNTALESTYAEGVNTAL